MCQYRREGAIEEDASCWPLAFMYTHTPQLHSLNCPLKEAMIRGSEQAKERCTIEFLHYKLRGEGEGRFIIKLNNRVPRS